MLTRAVPQRLEKQYRLKLNLLAELKQSLLAKAFNWELAKELEINGQNN